MQGCCQQLPPRQEQWKTPAKLWPLGAFPLPHSTISLSLRFALLSKHSCLLGRDPHPDRDEEQHPATTVGHHRAHTSAGKSNSYTKRAASSCTTWVYSLSLSMNFFRLCSCGFASFASPQIFFNKSNFLDTSAEILWPAHQPAADAHPHPMWAAATVQSSQQRLFSERFDPNWWHSNTAEESRMSRAGQAWHTHTRPVRSQWRATGLLFWQAGG